MRHLAAYLLLKLGGNDAPDADAITGVLTAVGIEADADQVAKIVADLEGKDLNELIAKGSENIA